MAHTHPVNDTDTLFVIDPITRAVVNAESKKTMLMQYDHNSEQFTFEIPRYVEEHDMSLCNRVEIHYNNVEGSTRAKNSGVYEVQDLTITGDKVTFTWLISENATFLAGSLSFLILFACVEDGVTTYRWNTNINNSITISSGIDNSGAIAEVYPDILAQWKEELFSTNLAYEAALENGFEGSITDWLDSLKGEPGVSDVFIGLTYSSDPVPTNENVLWCAAATQVEAAGFNPKGGAMDILLMVRNPSYSEDDDDPANPELMAVFPRTSLNCVMEWPSTQTEMYNAMWGWVTDAKTDLNQSWGVSLGEAKAELTAMTGTVVSTNIESLRTELNQSWTSSLNNTVNQLNGVDASLQAQIDTLEANMGSNIQLTTEDPGVGATSEFADGTIIAVYE